MIDVSNSTPEILANAEISARAIEAYCSERYERRYGYSAIVECFDVLDMIRHEMIDDNGAPNYAEVEAYVDIVSDRFEDIRNA